MGRHQRLAVELYEPSAAYRPIVFPPDGDPIAVRANTAVAAAEALAKPYAQSCRG